MAMAISLLRHHWIKYREFLLIKAFGKFECLENHLPEVNEKNHAPGLAY